MGKLFEVNIDTDFYVVAENVRDAEEIISLLKLHRQDHLGTFDMEAFEINAHEITAKMGTLAKYSETIPLGSEWEGRAETVKEIFEEIKAAAETKRKTDEYNSKNRMELFK